MDIQKLAIALLMIFQIPIHPALSEPMTPRYSKPAASIGEWFQRQWSRMSGYCCDRADGMIEGTRGFSNWWFDRSKGIFMVVIDGETYPVPKDALTDYMHEGNPNDGAVVWVHYDFDGQGNRFIAVVHCFTPSEKM
jgi:hypothetical protein